MAAKEVLIEQLQRQIAWLRKQIFGSKSERDQNQLELMLQGLEDQVDALKKEPEPPRRALQIP